jgi:hypothetical protein
VARLWAAKTPLPRPNPDFGRFWPVDAVWAGAKAADFSNKLDK